jgi:superfamily II DNA or RNA helicase
MPKKAVKGAIERLRTGELSALVHCHMLSEGVDMPWLRWMALRQARGSRVEFLQEFGRVLRAAPGKTEAVIFDPHELTRDHPLTGWLEVADADDAEPASEKEPDPTEDPLTGDAFEWDKLPEKERKKVLALYEFRAYLSASVVALTASGLLNTIGGDASKWRVDKATDRQSELLRKFSKTANWATQQAGRMNGTETDFEVTHIRAVAKIIRVLIQASNKLAESSRVLPRGIVSDACSLGRALLWGHGRNHRDDRPPEQVKREAFAALERYSVDPSHVLAGFLNG